MTFDLFEDRLTSIERRLARIEREIGRQRFRPETDEASPGVEAEAPPPPPLPPDLPGEPVWIVGSSLIEEMRQKSRVPWAML